ncbi:14804_t:CDS:2 [Dentiscutata heterogama]|uniref:14804_t:CDS:1 n=1 Tax=Dentiscutata heterogama TaxID=1316150 RepID=A0ACA9K0B4_9GLOM|nr:14804_t:CDS:2 [Dentiscutata heterogama]
MRDQGHDRSLNNKVMDICHIEVGRKDCEGLKRRGKVKMGRIGDGKNNENNRTLGKIVKVNKRFTKASIRLSSSLNLRSVRYARSIGITWKHLNEDDKVVGCVSSVEIDVDSVEIVKTRCGFEWRDGKCCCLVRSDNDETMFVISQESKIDETIDDEYYVMKENNGRRKSNIADVRCILIAMRNDNVNVRCIKSRLMKYDGIDNKGKKNRNVNVSDKRKSNQNNVIKEYQNNNDEKVIKFGGSSSDCRVRTDSGVVNDENRSLNNNCHNSLIKQWMRHMRFMNNWIRDTAWLRKSEH